MSVACFSCHATSAGCELTLISFQHDPRTAQDPLEQPALTGLRLSYLGRAPRYEVHLATDVIRHGIADASQAIPIDVPHEQHIDVAAGVIVA